MPFMAKLTRMKALVSVPFLLVLLSLFLQGCATGPKTRYREGDNTGQQTAMTVQDEEKMTREVLPEMQKQYPPVNNPELQAYVSAIGKKLVAANRLEGNPYHYTFTVVDVNYVNAFALPAGTVFVTAPLIKMAETEAELAGVIGHEIGHIQARHTAERMEAAKREEGKTALYAGGGGLLGGLAGLGMGKLLCKGDTSCMVKAAAVGVAAGAGGGLLVQKYKFMANSREDEMEADRIGYRIATRAGYSGEHVGRFYEKLLKMEQEHKKNGVPLLASLTDAMSTHPPSQERVEQMNQMARETPSAPGAIVSSPQFTRARTLVR